VADGKVVLETGLDDSGVKEGLGKLPGIIKAGIAALGISKIVGEIAQIGKAAVSAGSDFEAGMSQVSAISGATGSDLEALTEKAKEMGAKTKFSATESTQAFKYMAMAGWKTADMLDGIGGVMDLAAASGEDLASTSDIVTDALTAFGLSAKDSGHFADVLAKASSNSNTNVGMMGETFKYVAPVAGALGYSVEDTAVAVGLMANAGIKASQAGTSLRAILSRMAKPTDEVQAAMDALGISLTDSEGNMKSLDETMGDLRAGFAGLTEAEAAQMAAALGGQEAMSGLLAIVNASDDNFNQLKDSIYHCDGATAQMAATMQDNLKGKITILGSTLEGLGIQIYESMESPLKSAADAGIDAVGRISKAFAKGGLKGAVGEAAKQFDKLTDKVADSNEVMGDIIDPVKNVAKYGLNLGKKVLPVMADGFKLTAKHLDVLVPLLTAGVTAYKGYSKISTVTTLISNGAKAWKTASAAVDAYNVVQIACTAQGVISNATLTAGQSAVGLLTGKVTLATAATTLWNGAMNANPIALVVTGIAGLTAGIAAYCIITGDAQEKTYGLTEEEKKLLDSTNEVTSSLNEQHDAREKSVQAIDREYDGYSALLTELQSITDSNGRVKEGYEDRAKVITGQLADAMGVEIEMIDGVIQKYDETVEAIQNVITQKKAEALLATMEEDMANAYDKTREAMDAYQDEAAVVAEKKKDVEEATKKAAEAEKAFEEAQKSGTGEATEYSVELLKANEAVKAAKDAHAKATTEMENARAALSNLSTDVNNYDALVEAVASKDAAAIESAMTALVSSYKSYTSEMLASSQETRTEMYNQANGYIGQLKLIQDGTLEVADSVQANLAKAAVESIKEFNKLPGGIARGLQEVGPEASAAMVSALSVADLGGKLDAEAKQDVEKFISGFSALAPETQETFAQAWYGALQGLEGFENLADPAKDGADVFLKSLKDILMVHSPSQAVAEIFGQVWPGASKGLESGKEDLAAKGQGVVSGFLSSLTDGGLLEGAQKVGSDIMAFFGIGVSSQEGNSRAAGIGNAAAANAGAASVSPLKTGSGFGKTFSTGITSMLGTLNATGKSAANTANAGAASVNPRNTGSAFGKTLDAGINSLKGTLRTTGVGIANSAKSGAGTVKTTDTGKNFASMFVQAISGQSGAAKSTSKSMATSARSGLSSVATYSTGSNFGAGFVSGISGMIGSAVGAASRLASSAMSAIKSRLSIHSPSKETEKLGSFTGEGFVIGMEDSIPDVKKSSIKLSEAALEGLDIAGTANRMRAAIAMENAQLGAIMATKVVHEVEIKGQGRLIAALEDKLDALAGRLENIQIRVQTQAQLQLDGRQAGDTLTPYVSVRLGDYAELKERGSTR